MKETYPAEEVSCLLRQGII